MRPQSAIRVNTAFCLAFDIERTPERKSGFRPAKFDSQAGKQLFGDLRLKGFASSLLAGFAKKLVIVGGIEGRCEDGTLGRAWGIRQMLIRDFDIAAERMEAIQSGPSTRGNIETIGAVLADRDHPEIECAVISNHYHLPRVQFEMHVIGLTLPVFPAEAFWLLAGGPPAKRGDRKRELIAGFGNGPLAERMVEEINGIADKLRGE